VFQSLWDWAGVEGVWKVGWGFVVRSPSGRFYRFSDFFCFFSFDSHKRTQTERKGVEMSVFQVSSKSFQNEVVLTSPEETDKCIPESLALRPFVLPLFCFNPHPLANIHFSLLYALLLSVNVLWLGLLYHATPTYPIPSRVPYILESNPH